MNFCELAVAVGLSFTACDTQVAPSDLEPQDPSVFDYARPVPPPPPPPQITMPPVVVEVEKEVIRPAPAPPAKTIVKTQYIEVPKVIQAPVVEGPNPYEIQVQATLLDRYSQEVSLSDEGDLVGKVSEDVEASPPTPPSDDISAPEEPEKGKYEAPGVLSSLSVDNSRILTADRYLTGILESGINSQLSGEGSVVIQISRNVFGYHGRKILVPKGSRMICDYSSASKAGQTRIGFDCKRILLGESRAEIYQLNSHLSDVQGYAGLSGEVDNRWWEKYGSAVITTGISASVQAATALAGTIGEDGETAASALTAISENFGLLSAQFLEETVDLKPIIRISQGTRVLIKLENDWYIATP